VAGEQEGVAREQEGGPVLAPWNSVIPSLATTVHFSALAFLGAHKFPKQPDLIFRTIYLLSNPSESANL